MPKLIPKFPDEIAKNEGLKIEKQMGNMGCYYFVFFDKSMPLFSGQF